MICSDVLYSFQHAGDMESCKLWCSITYSRYFHGKLQTKNGWLYRGNGNGGSLDERKLAVEILAGSWVPYVGRSISFNFPHATDFSNFAHRQWRPWTYAVTIFHLPRPQVFKSHTFLNVLLGGSRCVPCLLYVLAASTPSCWPYVPNMSIRLLQVDFGAWCRNVFAFSIIFPFLKIKL